MVKIYILPEMSDKHIFVTSFIHVKATRGKEERR